MLHQTVFRHAVLYCAVPVQSVKVATALNWQMVCGCVAASNPRSGSFDPVRYNNTYAAEFALVKQHAMPLAAGFKVMGQVWVGGGGGGGGEEGKHVGGGAGDKATDVALLNAAVWLCPTLCGDPLTLRGTTAAMQQSLHRSSSTHGLWQLLIKVRG